MFWWEFAGFLSLITGIRPASSRVYITFNQFAICIHYVCPPFWVMKTWKAVTNRKSIVDYKWCSKSISAINWSIVLVSTFKVIKAETLEGTRMCLGNRSPRTPGLSQIPCAQIKAAKSNGIYYKILQDMIQDITRYITRYSFSKCLLCRGLCRVLGIQQKTK